MSNRRRSVYSVDSFGRERGWCKWKQEGRSEIKHRGLFNRVEELSGARLGKIRGTVMGKGFSSPLDKRWDGQISR